MRFIMEMCCLAYIVLHRKFIGEYSVVSYETDKSLTLTYEIEGGVYTLRSQQYIYIAKATGWLAVKKKYYLYQVKLIPENSTIVEDKPTTGIYFRQCPNFLRGSTYPHRLAISAHFKRVFKGTGYIPTNIQLN